MDKLISVVICTYNRAELLANALQSLSDQSVDPSIYEVLVVDNNSTDQTRLVVEESASLHPNVHYFLETQQGHSHVRNRGWREAQGRYIGYLDDDGQAGETWLSAAEDIITRFQPGAFGGPYFAFYNSPKPHWYKDEYGSHVQGNQPRPLQPGEYLDGGNLFVRCDLFETVGGFNPNLGMVGKAIGYGDETEWLMRLRAVRPDELIYYDPRVWIKHLVLPRKMTWRWIFRQRFDDGRYSQRVWPGRTSLIGWLFQIVYFSFALSIDGIYGLLARDRHTYPFFENYLFEHTLNYIRRLGSLYEQRREVSGLH